MDSSSFDGAVLDPLKCSKLSMDEKRELVYELSKWSHGAPEMLQSWSRQEILQILCAEMGKERKYTGLTKLKIIENLLRVVAEKNSRENETTTNSDIESSHAVHQKAIKRPRKADQPSRLPVAADNSPESDMVNVKYCKNSACKAKLSEDCGFCKRCSCCICREYDDNKDPSLWLACSSESPYPGDACGLSCHLECALKHEKSGIAKNGFDGIFICVSCRKVNDLLGCLRKQLMIAKETRRVDILCYRLSLSQKLLVDTTRYGKIYEIIGEAMKLLEAEVGPLTGLPVKKARGIVNRLSSGPEVQGLCASAMESLEGTVSTDIVHVTSNRVTQAESNFTAPDVVHVGDEATDPTNNTAKSPQTISSSLSNPSSVEDETNNAAPDLLTYFENKNAEKLNRASNMITNSNIITDSATVLDEEGSGRKTPSDPTSRAESLEDKASPDTENESDMPAQTGMECVPFVADLLITPSKVDTFKDFPARKRRSKPSHHHHNKPPAAGSPPENEPPPAENGSSSKKRRAESQDPAERAGNRDLEYYVKVIRWLEREGHVEAGFRQKFLTWYSLRATPEEVRVVKVFVDTLIDDPGSLAGQLVDTFSDVISSKRCSGGPSGLCLKLWH